MISSILERELLTVDSTINIAWTPCEDGLFEKFIKETCKPCNIISLTETYYGMNDISIIFCNNRLTHLDKSIELAKFFLCPIIIVDHAAKSELITNNVDMNILIKPIYQIAISTDISLSWNRIHDNVLQYSLSNQELKNKWKNLIFHLCKSHTVVKDDQIIKKK